MPAWVVWAVVAVLLAVGEIFTPGLFFLGPIALAALASTVVAALGGAIWLQIVVFGVGSFAAVGLLRPIAGAT
jgi:membrane protein implicated in regulation of membrane protease activity